ncbi:MAG: dienelactone hydrolase family protein, partial [Thermodesulfobacteriota bacterium]
MDRLDHGNDVFRRNLGTDVVYGRDDISSSGSEILDPLFHFFMLFRNSILTREDQTTSLRWKGKMSLTPCLRPLFLMIPLCLVLPVFSACHNAGLQTEAGPPSVRSLEKRIATSLPQRVSFDSLDRDPATGKPVVIQALLFRPEGADFRRLPAVVALHGCGGMYSTVKSKRDTLSIRHQMMADLLVSEGYAVLFPDSFRSRGFEEICTVENKKRTLRQQHRRLDAQGALAWLQRRHDVLPERVAVLGWSHGASTVLATINAKQPAVANWREREPSV